MEKRQHPRIDCRIEGRLRIAQHEVAALVRNVSEGGLALQAPVEPTERGEMAYLKLQPRRGPEIELAVLLWHFKKLRKVATGETVTQLGVALASGSEPYFDLVRSLQRKVDAARARRRPPRAASRPARGVRGPAPGPGRAAREGRAGPSRRGAARRAREGSGSRAEGPFGCGARVESAVRGPGQAARRFAVLQAGGRRRIRRGRQGEGLGGDR